MVTRDDLRRELWPRDTFVDFEHGLNAAVKRLREALGDSAATPRFIETLPRRGYRFIALIDGPRASSVSKKEAEPAREQPVAAIVRSTTRHSRSLKAVAITAYCVAAAIMIVTGRSGVRDTVASLLPAQRVITTVAVLPLTKIGDQADGDTFVALVAGELHRQLEAIDSLRVTSPESMKACKASTESPLEIGRELKVSILVSGTVLRNGDRTILDMQVVDVRSGEPIWAHRYETTLARLPQAATEARWPSRKRSPGSLEGNDDCSQLNDQARLASCHPASRTDLSGLKRLGLKARFRRPIGTVRCVVHVISD